MAGWHHQHNGHEFEQVSGDSEGWESLACCCPWCHKELDRTSCLKNNKSTKNTVMTFACSIASDSMQPKGLTAALQTPMSIGFSGRKTGGGCHFLPREDFSDSGFESLSAVSPALAGSFFITVSPAKPK